MSHEKPRVLNVGQCNFDHGNISKLLADQFGSEVESADSVEEARAAMQESPFDLVLVNRVFDRDGHEGLDFIRLLKSDEKNHDVPVMLVSNYEDAQNSAVELGAIRGFGKGALTDEATRDLLASVLLR